MDYTLNDVNITIENLYLAEKFNLIDIHHEDLTASTDIQIVLQLVKKKRSLQLNIYEEKDSIVVLSGRVRGVITYLNDIYYISYIHKGYQYVIKLSYDWETSIIKRQFRYQEDPIGMIKIYAGTTIPEGYLLCDGSLIYINSYPKLFDVIGTTFNNSVNVRDHSRPYVPTNMFRVPDLRRRFIVGYDRRRNVQETRGLDSDYFNIGKMGGSNEIILNAKTTALKEHTHTVGSVTVYQNYDHSHKWFGDDWLYELIKDSTKPAWNLGIYRISSAKGYDAHSELSGESNLYSTSRSGIHDHKGTINIRDCYNYQATYAHENRPPCYVLKYIIKAKY